MNLPFLQRLPRWQLAVGLALLTCLLYLPVLHHQFITYDDPEYVIENPMIRPGVTWAGLKWAFTSAHSASWHPLTSLSEMLDCQVFGLKAGAHLMVNVLLHAASAALLFLLLQRATGSTWRSLAVAAFFAWHPLRVESVAWVSERKDVLCGLFWMLTLLAYFRYTEQPGRGRYGILLASFALGIMTKAMIVTLPIILLLLDLWPLRRLPFPPVGASDSHSSAGGWREWLSTLRRLIFEKAPLFVLCVVLVIATLLAQRSGGALVESKELSLAVRLGHAVTSCVQYLKMQFWPVNLCVFYPYSGPPTWWQTTGAAGLVLAATVFALRLTRAAPYVLVGWLWYLITLLPVIGVVQVGAQSVADRYTYLPTIGMLLIVVWGVTDCFAQRHWPPKPLTLAAGLGLALCLAGTHNQLARWQNTESLFLHALRVTSNNMVAHGNLANYYAAQGKNDQATQHYLAVLQINPDQAETHNNLGMHLANLGKLDEAVSHYQTALRLKPAYAEAHNNLGVAFLRRQKLKEAAEHFAAAARLQPKLMSAQFNLGLVLAALGKLDEAATHMREAAKLDPHDASVQFQLALVLWKQREFATARQHLETALAQKTDWALAVERLSWLLATAPDAQVRDGRRALELALRAKSLAGANAPEIWNTLAAAYAENGSFDQAVTAGQKAVELAGQTRRTELLPEYQKRLAMYQASQPVRDPP